MGGGGVVEIVEMMEMYLQNKYTKTPLYESPLELATLDS
jgi:hypothetical protein